MDEVDGLSTPWFAAMAEKTWWAPREVNLTLSAAAATSFVIFSLFGREAEAAALPRAEELVSDEEVDESAHSAVARSPTQSSLPSPSPLLTPSPSSFSQQPTSHVS
ncbi:hypothetical protein GWK47_026080 [Chionoecetes opilio]|uniref:Uncharacterized protein n=1 Tax=Chionoecetes opilio TaxID=41210 RepID=A0A8J8WEF4_CHIOP|nr:hypothetical protein GWK47_026080 [Chionoecetes opilio]